PEGSGAGTEGVVSTKRTGFTEPLADAAGGFAFYTWTMAPAPVGIQKLARVKTPRCGWKLEKAAQKCGALRIAGLDEVGRGPMFGPVVAAAVILDCGTRFRGLTDSKKLPEKKRIELDVEIRAKAVAWAIAAVDAETIDRINIRRASLLAMRLAVEQLSITPDYLLIDGVDTIEWACPQQSVIQGDGTSYSIAAASVLAKVYRDGLLVEFDRQYPGYGLASHK